MSRWDIRNDQSTSPFSRRSIRALLRRSGSAGRVGPAHAGHRDLLEALENRVLLAGDEPNFTQVFNTPTPLTPPEIVLDGQGVGVSVTGAGSSAINPGGDDDVFRFTAPANDFVRIWGDALSTLSPLDSRVEVYTGIVGGAATLIASGSNQGTLTTGSLIDGWAGFKAVQGQEYFIVVKSDQLSGAGSIGDYTLRISAKSLAFPTPATPSGQSTTTGTLTRPGSDVMYKLILPSDTLFNGLMIVQATAIPADFDTRIDVYDSFGTLIRGDSDSGSQTDSYMRMVIQPNALYYIRVRSDEFGDPLLRPSTGAFTVLVDGIPDVIPVDPVTRLSPRVGGAVADAKEMHLYSFTAQGTGLSFISLAPAGLPPIPDSFLHLYNEAGVEVGTNELPGATSRMLIQLTGGVRYFLVVECFDAIGGGGGGYVVQVEAHHNYDQAETIPMDDHINLPANGPGAQAQFELATPVVWGPPVDATVGITGLNPPPPDPAGDHVKVVVGKATGRIHTAGDSDLFQFVPPVDMLGMFGGHDNLVAPPGQSNWQLKNRPATRLQVIAVSEGAFLTDATIRIYDSNLQLIYGPNDRLITTAQGNNISGGLDPASWPPTLPVPFYGYTFSGGQPIALSLDFWGGEVYYLAVTSGGGSGRYTISIQADAPVDTTGIAQFLPTITNSGQFSTAWEVRLDANTGEGRNFNNSAGGAIIDNGDGTFTAAAGAAPILLGQAFAMNLLLPAPAGAGAVFNNFNVNPGTKGRGLLRLSDFGNLTSPTDSDLYQVRAIYSGTMEVRLNTTQITDGFFEGSVDTEDGDPLTPPAQTVLAAKTKTYNSPLDGALRIFDNDQTQIYYNNDNGVTAGESDVTNVGALAGYTFQRRDPRAVFTVEAGKTYYIQVESGQRSNFSLTFPKVDWRHATGSYELLVNSMSNLNFADDHLNAPQTQQATPIPVNLNTTSTTAALGSVNGQILNVAIANPNDTDVFTFISPGDGIATFTLALRSANPPAAPIPFARIIQVFPVTGGIPIGQATGSGTGDLTVSVAARQGDRFFVVIDGDETAGGAFQGLYTVSVSGVPFKDDYASENDYLNAHVIDKDLYDYDGTETLNGLIDTVGDTDLFTFQSLAFDIATVTVTGVVGMAPSIKIYEISIDPAGNPIRLLIANNTAGIGQPTATISFSVTAPPRTTGTESYPNYFIVVGGRSADVDRGAYTLTLSINNTTDDHPDGPNPPPPGTPSVAGQFSLATPIVPGPTGNGGSSGVIELQGDTDLFTFTAPAQGTVFVSLVSPTSSHLLPRIRIIDANFNAVTDIGTSSVFVTGADIPNSVATFTFTAARNAVFYIMVEGVNGSGNTFKTDDVGSYFLTLSVPVPDDHANVGEFNIATVITLSQFSGGGSDTGLISPATDTDLFTFTAILSGNMVVTVSTPGSAVNPGLRLYAPNQSELGTLVLDGGVGDDDGQVNGSVTRHFAIVQGSQYWVLVSSDQTGIQTTGSYLISLAGPSPTVLPDDHANAGDYANATQIVLDQTTGDGNATGNIEIPLDTDLFYFVSLAGSPTRPLTAFIQIVTPAGQLLDVGVRIIRDDQTTIVTTDTGGGPGYNAGVNFGITATGERYYIEVDGLGNLSGSYTVRVDTSPESYFLYYPDGYATTGTREFISIGNTNGYDVNYTMTLKYEDISVPTLVIAGVATANKRTGVTLADGSSIQVALNKHYAIIIEADGFLGANFSHYDTNASLGEAFSRQPSTVWSFAKGEKFAGAINDELITYNPNAGAASVTLTTYQLDGTAATTTRTVPGFSRLTWAFNSLPNVPVGQFAFTVTSQALSSGSPHIGIVASLSHYDISNADGYAVMGDNHGGASTGVLPGLVDSGNLAPSQFSEITLFNSSNAVANINLLGRYQSSNIPDLIRPITLNPHESITLTGIQLGLVANQTVGLRYDSNVNVTVLESTRRFGDSDATQAQSDAGNKWYFGDAFINRLRAGQLYFENMYFYNPASTDIAVTLNFIFNTGAPSSYTFNLPARNFGAVALHQLTAVLSHAVMNFFSIEATSTAPFIVSMTHYDLVLAGGWGSAGAPLGLTNPIISIP